MPGSAKGIGEAGRGTATARSAASSCSRQGLTSLAALRQTRPHPGGKNGQVIDSISSLGPQVCRSAWHGAAPITAFS
jgi:hypothetical protein